MPEATWEKETGAAHPSPICPPVHPCRLVPGPAGAAPHLPSGRCHLTRQEMQQEPADGQLWALMLLGKQKVGDVTEGATVKLRPLEM